LEDNALKVQHPLAYIHLDKKHQLKRKRLKPQLRKPVMAMDQFLLVQVLVSSS
jgi:hypothetical protein